MATMADIQAAYEKQDTAHLVYMVATKIKDKDYHIDPGPALKLIDVYRKVGIFQGVASNRQQPWPAENTPMVQHIRKELLAWLMADADAYINGPVTWVEILGDVAKEIVQGIHAKFRSPKKD